MGKILNLKSMKNAKVNLNLEMSQSEIRYLSGNLESMHLFSELNLEYRTRLVQRGKRESTKYFLMPKEFRKGLIPSNNIECNKIETDKKNIFIFAVNKYGEKFQN